MNHENFGGGLAESLTPEQIRQLSPEELQFKVNHFKYMLTEYPDAYNKVRTFWETQVAEYEQALKELEAGNDRDKKES